MKQIVIVSLWSLQMAFAAPIGFGERGQKKTTIAPPVAPAPVVSPAPDVKAQVSIPTETRDIQKPMNLRLPDDEEWVRVPFEKAENEVLALFHRDLPKIGELASNVALFEVRASGRLPADYTRGLRSKIEKILITSGRMNIRECAACQQSRLVKDESGEVRYESVNADPARAAKLASELGIDRFINAELIYTPEDLELRIRLVEPISRDIKWVGSYSASEVVKTREKLIQTGRNQLEEGDSLSRVLIGEIAFTTVLSPGVAFYPTVADAQSAGTNVFYPSVDLLIGEKYDRGYKRFGFVIGGSFNLSMGGKNVKPLPFLFRVAPQYRYTFNPHSMSNARISVGGELGGMSSVGLGTAYLGLLAELQMQERFSVSFVPLYILTSSVGGGQTFVQTADGGFDQRNKAEIGNFGGLGFLVRGSMNW